MAASDFEISAKEPLDMLYLSKATGQFQILPSEKFAA